MTMRLFSLAVVPATISVLLANGGEAFMSATPDRNRNSLLHVRKPTTIISDQPRATASITRFGWTPGQARLKNTELNAASRSELASQFMEQVEKSLAEDTFVSLVLRGAKKKKGKKKDINEDDMLRGSIRQVQGRLIKIASKKKKSRQKKNDTNGQDELLTLQMTVKYHEATDICKNFDLFEVPKTIYNLLVGDPAEMASEWGVEAVRAQSIQSAELVTTNEVCELRLDIGKLKTAQVTASSVSASVAAKSHDRVKQVPLSNQAEFLQKLGVTKADGQPKPRMKGKLRQCQKFVEIVGRIVDECQKQERKKITVVDMGCGRAYLTFSLHSYLQEKYGSVITTGIDVRPKLVAEISGIARLLGTNFDTLNFEEGTIEKVVAHASTIQKEDENSCNSLDVLVALHACDTATDDALYSGIAQNADVIVVAPCCHKQLRPQLNAHFSSTRQTHTLSSILKHPVYRERISETVTDSLRALLLEFAGYKVQVFEFIGGEHTSKNVMITAIKASQKPSEKDLEAMRLEIISLAALHGIRQQKLAEWMKLDIVEDGDQSIPSQERALKKKSPKQVSTIRMPPARS